MTTDRNQRSSDDRKSSPTTSIDVETLKAALEMRPASKVHEWVSTIIAMGAVLAAIFGAFFTLRGEVEAMKVDMRAVEQRRIADRSEFQREVERVEHKVQDLRNSNLRLTEKIDRVNANTIRICQKLNVPCD